jgi:hypothetical protein
MPFQRLGRQENLYQLSIASGTIITGPGMRPARFLQAGIVLLMFFFSLLQLIGKPNRWNASIRWSQQASCYTITLQRPSHAEVVLEQK